MANRTDIHRPASIIPADYDFVGIWTARNIGVWYLPLVVQERQRIEAHMARTEGEWATHEHGGNCMSCGAHCSYMAVFFHRYLGEYIRTGMDCAEKIGIGDVNRFRTFTDIIKAARHHQAGKRKAEGLLKEAGLTGCWNIYLTVRDVPALCRHLGFTADTPPGILADFAQDNGMDASLVMGSLVMNGVDDKSSRIADVVATIVKKGKMSSRQQVFLTNLLAEVQGVKKEPPSGPREEVRQTRTYRANSRTGGITEVTTDRTAAEAVTILRRGSGDFAGKLVSQYDDWAAGRSRYESPFSPRQMDWVQVLAEEILEEERRVSQTAEAVVTDEDQVDGILALFEHASEHLQFPKIRLAVPRQGASPEESPHFDSYLLYRQGERARHPGWIIVRVDKGQRVAEISTDGLLIPLRGVDLTSYPGLVEMIRRLAQDPVTVAAEYGKLTGSCCFCALTLTDERSTEVGYGPVCAKHYHLPWGNQTNARAVPVPVEVVEYQEEEEE